MATEAGASRQMSPRGNTKAGSLVFSLAANVYRIIIVVVTQLEFP